MSGTTLLFSDVHGKADRLERLLRLYPENPAFCLGDVVGTGDSDGTLELLKSRQIPCLLGNHEVDLIHLYQVSDEHLRWIKSWPWSLTHEDAHLAHTWLTGRCFEQIDSISSASSCFADNPARLRFVGHSHSPGWWELSPGSRPRWTHAALQRELMFQAESRYIVDVGSLGEPQRVEDPHYALWDVVGVRWFYLPA